MSSANLLLARVEELREQLRRIDVELLAANCAATWRKGADGGGELGLSLWGKHVAIQYPQLTAQDVETGKDLSLFSQALLIYHLFTSDGAPEAGLWVSFSELPEGRFYNQAFQGYTGGELGLSFGDDLPRFESSARACGGSPLSNGDAAFAFRMLPRVSLAVVAWRGDEDFPSAYQVLFDAASWHHLPTDACAIAGSTLTHRLITAGMSLP